MPDIEASVLIARSPEDVFDFLIAAENLPVWDASVIAADQVGDGPVGLGTRTKGASKIMGKRFDWVTEVTHFESPTGVTYTSIEGPMTFTVTSALEAESDGTRLTYRIHAESGLGGVFGRMADPLITKAQTRTVRANLDTLADLLVETTVR